jgi:hypothetical protein
MRAERWLNHHPVTAESPGLTRLDFVALTGAAGMALLGLRPGAAVAAEGTATAAGGYVSRPDLRPPPIEITTAASGTSRGAIFLAPFDISAAADGSQGAPAGESHSGPLVVDDRGEPLWFLPLSSKTAMDFRAQRYQGRPVLTWYEGTVLGPYGGEFVIFDPTYHRVARVRAGRGRHGDLHEFLLTSRGTALITIYNEVAADLRSVAGPRDGRLVTGIVQEIDLATGTVVFEWRSREHVGLDESFMTDVTPSGNVDYFHLNSVAVDHDGHLLVSARHTSAIYKIHRRTGDVLWRLGGKRSDFAIARRASFAFQHDVRRHPDGTLTIFDNRAALPAPGVASRAIRIRLDEKRRRATLVRAYEPTDARSGWAMGNAQQLADGGLFVGWGTDGSFSEFTAGGDLRFDARFADGSVTYRAFRMPWTARPTGEPAVAVTRSQNSTMIVFVSWNGATDVARWRVEVGQRADRLTTRATTGRSGFETAITLPDTTGYLSVVALDASSRPLAATQPVAI